MYFTQDVNAVGCPHVVRMSFELPYLDWCRFQKSQLFHDLTEYLEERGEPGMLLRIGSAGEGVEVYQFLSEERINEMFRGEEIDAED